MARLLQHDGGKVGGFGTLDVAHFIRTRLFSKLIIILILFKMFVNFSGRFEIN